MSVDGWERFRARQLFHHDQLIAAALGLRSSSTDGFDAQAQSPKGRIVIAYGSMRPMDGADRSAVARMSDRSDVS